MKPKKVQPIGKTQAERDHDMAKLVRMKKEGKLRGGINVTDPGTKKFPEERELALRDAELQKKYKHYVPGTVQRDEMNSKFEAQIKCSECNKTRRVWTSDVFQVKLCLDCKASRTAQKNAQKKMQEKPKAKPTKEESKRATPETSLDKWRRIVEDEHNKKKNPKK